MALSLYSEAAYEDVFAAVAQGLAWKDGTPNAPVTDVSKAGSRLTWKALQAIRQRCCAPLTSPEHPHAFFAGYRLVIMDGSNFEVADEKEKVAVFGYPGSRTGHADYPQTQCAILVVRQPCHPGCEAGQLPAGGMGSGRALAAQPHARHAVHGRPWFCGLFPLAGGHKNRCAVVVVHAKNLILPVEKQLDDGSYLSSLYPSERDRKQRINGIAVRVIEYTLPNVPDSEPMYRLLTTLPDDQNAPAQALAVLYHERWEVEMVFDELKTHLAQRRRVFRSKTPELVRQEFYGWVMAHYAVRWLMYQVAAHACIPGGHYLSPPTCNCCAAICLRPG